MKRSSLSHCRYALFLRSLSLHHLPSSLLFLLSLIEPVAKLRSWVDDMKKAVVKVGLFCDGSRGDTQPFIALARGLDAAGFEVWSCNWTNNIHRVEKTSELQWGSFTVCLQAYVIASSYYEDFVRGCGVKHFRSLQVYRPRPLMGLFPSRTPLFVSFLSFYGVTVVWCGKPFLLIARLFLSIQLNSKELVDDLMRATDGSDIDASIQSLTQMYDKLVPVRLKVTCYD